jgi:hypothetical protein
MHCVRDGDFKYIRSEDGTEELYHLGLDPAESQNFALDSSHTALLNRMRNLFERNVAERQSTHPNASVAAPRIPATSTKVLRGMARTQ